VDEAEGNRVRRLPPGPHGIPPELVERNQRERLIAAMAEVCAEDGYGGATVAEVTRRAGVSTASFYRQFEDKRACMLASFGDLFGRLLGEIERACAAEGEPGAKAKAGIHTAAVLLVGDLPTARLLTVEIVAVGAEGVRLQHEAIEQLAMRLREVHVSALSADPALLSPEWVAVAAMVALVAKRSAAGENLNPAELEAVFDAVAVSF
jgi:AcrR family transcriptional regulator